MALTRTSAARHALEQVITYLTDEFIEEQCIGNITEGCMSCEMIGVRASLRKAVELIDAFAELVGSEPLPLQRGEHLSDCAVHNEPAYPNGPCDCGADASKSEE